MLPNIMLDIYDKETLTNILATIGILILFLLVLKGKRRLGTNPLPPGPFSLPWVGYLSFSKEPEHVLFKRLRKKYGDIFGLQIGFRNVVVVSDYETMKEMGNMDEFVARPPHVFEISPDFTHVAEMSGPAWKEQRKLVLRSLRSLGMGKTEGTVAIQNQIEEFLELVSKHVGQPEVNIRNLIRPVIKNIIFGFICNKTFQDEPQALKAISDYQDFALTYLLQKVKEFYFPWLKIVHHFQTANKNYTASHEEFTKVIENEIKTHEKELTEEGKQDYMDYYIEEMRGNKSKDNSFDRLTLQGNTEILLMAGSEATRITLEWCLFCMADHQAVQDRVYKEIVDCVGKDKILDWEDRQQTPYTQAVILEINRWKDLVPINDPRWTTEDVVFRGYTIPKETVILLNFSAVHHSTKIWGDPENFRPERFLTSDGKYLDSKMVEHVVIFSFGKRSCPGEKLASVQLYLYFCSIIQKFRIIPPKGGVVAEHTMSFAPILLNPLLAFENRD